MTHARDVFPDAIDRIAQACDLVLAGAIVQHADGSFTVTHPSGRASQVWQEFGLPLEALVWIEHYPYRGFDLPEVFAQVTFEVTPQGLCHPQWQWLTITQVEAMIEQTL